MYMKGQHSIPSDTVCYPAKLMHGHIENLLEKGVDAIFYPCMTYNLDEGRASNCYNCPVVAYYPELLKANVSALTDFDFMMPYFELADPKRFRKHAVSYSCKKYPQLKKKKVLEAADAAYQAQQEYCTAVRLEGQKAIRYADEHGLDVAVIAGRPYHVDPEINHGIDQLISSFGLVIVSEDAVWQLTDAPEVHVLNQWTYHSRMYGAAKYVTQKENAQLIQLVSFGCGIDAITTDEMRAICENGGKIYTHSLKSTRSATSARQKIRIEACWLPKMRRAENLQNTTPKTYDYPQFTEEMRRITPSSCPICSRFSFGLICRLMRNYGYKMELLHTPRPEHCRAGSAQRT